MRGRELQLVGQRFGMLVVNARLRLNEHRKVVWSCTCDCGKTGHEATSGDLRSGKVASCGCVKGGAREIRPKVIGARRKKAKAAKEAGLTTREIARALSVSQATASRDTK